ncbi:tyrosine-type recombinase/integrase [Sporolactobacillus laevolacticus]|uniref:tyrosine-type recombinase/integrase n=1 Tax=Sporolactobacillus laevolacticus TaxID=33018 RepID=UPI0025B2B823|nr:tyrosine-type recombinase/integrase [Sporolactobacillus laevolacticus]MDN3956221.1 tyrosine-type recombinase/integrase [Sporolactobacillus laevolacticus]
MDNCLLFLDRFMLHCSAKNLSPKSMRSYDQTLRLFFIFLRDEKQITDVKKIRQEDIEDYINFVRERGKYTVNVSVQQSKYNKPMHRRDFNKKVSESTIANYLRNIKVFFNYLADQRDINKNPVESIPNIKSHRKMKPLLSENELYMLMRSFDTSTFHGFRNWTITRLILDTGCRVGECLSIMRTDINMQNNGILLRYTKNGKERYVFFSDKMRKNLKSWLEYLDRYSDSNYIFPSIHGRKMDIRNFEFALRSAGESVGIKVAPHQLRNNFSKYYLLNGGDFATLSMILGHSSVEVTKNEYLDFTDIELSRNYQKHSPLNNLDI